jgi:hypothetical protein
MRSRWKQHTKIWKWGYGSSVLHYQTYVPTFSFHTVVYYTVTQRFLCLMFHKSRDITGLVLYIAVARMLNAHPPPPPPRYFRRHQWQDKHDSKLRIIEFKRKYLELLLFGTLSIVRSFKIRKFKLKFRKVDLFLLQVKEVGDTCTAGPLAVLSLWTRVFFLTLDGGKSPKAEWQ